MAYLQRLCRGHQMIENVPYWHIADVPLALTNVFLSNIALNPRDCTKPPRSRANSLVIPNANASASCDASLAPFFRLALSCETSVCRNRWHWCTKQAQLTRATRANIPR